MPNLADLSSKNRDHKILYDNNSCQIEYYYSQRRMKEMPKKATSTYAGH